jgi:2-polyprenyl-3-methyl-5-hydroxy-6-metoxy-1,4-benzoquinol methylase
VSELETKVKRCYEVAPFPDSLRSAADFDQELQRNVDWFALNLKYLSKSLITSMPRSILCAGCGTGEEAISLAKIFPKSKIDAIDISTASLAIAKENAVKASVKNITFNKLSIIDDLPNSKKKYDLVYSSGVVHHLSDPRLGFKNLREKINKKGHMVVMLYNSYGLFLYKCQLFLLNLVAKSNQKKRLAIVKFLKLGRGKSRAYVYDTYINPQVTTFTIGTVASWAREEHINLVGIVPPLGFARMIAYGTEGKGYVFRRKGLMKIVLAVANLISRVLGESNGNKKEPNLNIFRVVFFQLLFLVLGRGECQYLFKDS